jgi:signal recognition particle subunit SEC65
MESNESLKKSWVKVYPSYIDRTLKCSEGRKLASSLAVENPNIAEIFIVCAEFLKLDSAQDVIIKNKNRDTIIRRIG